jgi:hypothetical protein
MVVSPSYDPVERRTNNPQVVAGKFLRGKQKRRRKGIVTPETLLQLAPRAGGTEVGDSS